MTHDGQVFSMEQHTNLYFHHVEVINDLVESLQMYATHMYYHPHSTAEYKPKQADQASYYEKIIRNIDVVLQTDQVFHICKGLPQVPAPRYTATWYELENDNLRLILQSACGDADVADKEMQIIHMEFLAKRNSRHNDSESHSRIRNIDDLTDMGFNLTRLSPILTIGDAVPQTPVGSGTITPVPTSTPRPSGGSRLNNSDPIPNREHHRIPNLYNSYDTDRSISDVPWPFEFQRLTGPPSGPESLGTDNSIPTFDTTRFYPGKILFKNHRTSPAPPQPVAPMGTQDDPSQHT